MARWGGPLGLFLRALVLSLVLSGFASSGAEASSIYWHAAGTGLNEPQNGTTLSSFSCSGSICVASGYTEFYRHVAWANVGINLNSANGSFTSVDTSNMTGNAAPAFETDASFCLGSSFCVTAGANVYDYTGDLTDSSPSWSSNDIYPSTYSGTTGVHALSCVSQSLCVATDEGGNVLTTTDPSDGDPWSVQQIDTQSGAAQSLGLLTCSSDGLCLAANSTGDVYVDPTIGQGGSSWTKETVDTDLTSGASVTDVACPATSLCLLTDSLGNLFYSTTPAIASSWHVTSLSSAALNSVSCASADMCVTVDADGNAFTSFDPSIPSSWSEDALDSGNSLVSVGCSASTNECVTTDGTNVYIGTTSVLGPPAVQTGQVSPQHSSATLTGTVNPDNDKVSSCQFSYDTSQAALANDVSAGKGVPCSPASPGSGNTPVNVSAALSGLTPGTTYYYELTAANSWGSSSTPVASFTTTGTSPPSLDYFGASYNFGGEFGTGEVGVAINPHGNAGVTYQVFWMPSSFPNDKTPTQVENDYYFHTPVESVPGSGTTDVKLQAELPNVPSDMDWYYRIVIWCPGSSCPQLSDGTHAEVSPEDQFSSWYPLPTNISQPYLQANGGDATASYQLLCQPGKWTGGDGTYQVRWIELDDLTILGAAPGSTETYDPHAPGDLYDVTKDDIGHEIACQVSAEESAGTKVQWSAWETSDATIPEGSDKFWIPPWLKQIFKAQQVDSDFNTFAGFFLEDGPLDTCIAEATLGDAVPGLGLAACAITIGLYLGSTDAQNIISNLIDPPDRLYRQVAFLSPRKAPSLNITCPRRWSRRRCHALRVAAARYTAAQAQLMQAMALVITTSNRFLIARDRDEEQARFLQKAAAKVDMGYIAQAVEAVRRAAGPYMRQLMALHLKIPTLSKAEIARLPKTRLFQRLRSFGVSRREQAFLLSRLERYHAHLRASLRGLMKGTSPAPFLREYDQLGFSDLAAILQGMQSQHTVSSSAGSALQNELAVAQATCTSTGRSAALSSLLTQAKGAMNRRAYGFLAEAVSGLEADSSQAALGNCTH